MPVPAVMPRLATTSTGMEKIDRLGWAAGIAVTTYGRRIGVRANTLEALERAIACLPPAWETADSPVVDRLYSVVLGPESAPGACSRHFSMVYGEAARLARSLNREEVIEAFDSALNLDVAEWARGCLFVHAGVVGWQGQAIVLPGPSHAGKSTLVAALLRAGATYYSDEFAVFDAAGRVYPFPRRLSLRGAPGARPRRVTSADLGAIAGTGPLPVGLVALARYKPGARWRPRTRTVGQGVLDLLSNTVAARREPALACATLGRVASQARVVMGTRGEAGETAMRLLRMAPIGMKATDAIDGKGVEDYVA